MRILIALSWVVTFAAVGVAADDSLVWPRFRGPNGSGVAEGEKPPVEFGPDKNVKWKVPVPPGISSPIVAGELLVITAFDDGKLYTIAYRRADGSEAWRAEAPAEKIEAYHKVEGSPAASTPATDGQRIVSYFGSCGLFCYDHSGKELWRFEMPTVVTGGDFGSGVSPILADGLVILVRDEIKESKTLSRILALDAMTGQPKWEQKRVSPVSWCTPVVWDTAHGKQVVSGGHARMIGYDLDSGEERWSVASMPSGCCASPVVADGKLYFAGSSSGGEEGTQTMQTFDALLMNLDKDQNGAISKAEGGEAFQGFFDNQDVNKDGTITREEYEAIMKMWSEGKDSAFALKAGGSGDITASHVLWKKTKGLPYVASAILYRGQYVMVRDGGIVIANDAETGKQIYQARVAAGGRYYASPVAANGHIYFTSLDGGAITVLKAGADKAVVAAKNSELGERCAATPAIADNTLYLRTAADLYAFAETE
ncbi:MAG TPA: PQQ-binding-like beta-propeller repeat protein [Pirellulales bacterium]|nr:PQQ-binding-like beta-propeller repeat protein [Pirellulales bacterium]